MLVAEVEEEEEAASRQLVVGISAIRVHVAARCAVLGATKFVPWCTYISLTRGRIL